MKAAILFFVALAFSSTCYAGYSFLKKSKNQINMGSANNQGAALFQNEFLGPAQNKVYIEGLKMVDIGSNGERTITMPAKKKEWQAHKKLKIYHEIDWVQQGKEFRKNLNAHKKEQAKNGNKNRVDQYVDKDGNTTSVKLEIKSSGRRLKAAGHNCRELVADILAEQTTESGKEQLPSGKVRMCFSEKDAPDEVLAYQNLHHQNWTSAMFGKNTPEQNDMTMMMAYLRSGDWIKKTDAKIDKATRAAIKNGMLLSFTWESNGGPTQQFSHRQKTVKLKKLNVKNSLFEIPKGYKKVSSEEYNRRVSELQMKRIKKKMMASAKKDIQKKAQRAAKKLPGKMAEEAKDRVFNSIKDKLSFGF